MYFTVWNFTYFFCIIYVLECVFHSNTYKVPILGIGLYRRKIKQREKMGKNGREKKVGLKCLDQ